MADRLASGKPYLMFEEEPEHCAQTMYAVLESLFKARTELELLKSPKREIPFRRTTDHGGGDGN